MELLKDIIDERIIELVLGGVERNTGYSTGRLTAEMPDMRYGVALTARHKQAVTEAIENIRESINELKRGRDEVTAMMLRAAYQAISNIEQQHVDEQILERIFQHFCIVCTFQKNEV